MGKMNSAASARLVLVSNTSASLQNVVAYALLVVALIVMPAGVASLFGRRS